MLILEVLQDLIGYFNCSDAGDEIFWLWGLITNPADALAPKVARASAGMALNV